MIGGWTLGDGTRRRRCGQLQVPSTDEPNTGRAAPALQNDVLLVYLSNRNVEAIEQKEEVGKKR